MTQRQIEVRKKWLKTSANRLLVTAVELRLEGEDPTKILGAPCIRMIREWIGNPDRLRIEPPLKVAQ